MRRRILIALLSLGVIGGYGSAAAQMSCRAHARRAAWEQHVAKLCVDAARTPPPAQRAAPYPW